jgi:predicted  nucleic acid-binding Zn-ribbon protein
MDSDIFKKRKFIKAVPLRIREVDQPLKEAQSELEKLKVKNESLNRKKREKEKALEDINEKIKKMKARISDIKTNKEYQAHLKEIESSEREIEEAEDRILMIMEELDEAKEIERTKEEKVNEEVARIEAFKKELDREVEENEKALSLLKEERANLAGLIDPEVYSLYMKLLESGNGIAVTGSRNEICLGCNMNIPPQLFVEIRKNEEIIQCPQCRRILYYTE